MGDQQQFTTEQLKFLIEQFDKIKDELLELDKHYSDCKLMSERLKNIQKSIDEIKEELSTTSGKTTLEKVITILTALLSLVISVIAFYKSIHHLP